MEFEDKVIAKSVAAGLNGQQIGGKRRSAYHFDLWCMKYLPKFKWDHLTEEIAYEKVGAAVALCGGCCCVVPVSAASDEGCGSTWNVGPAGSDLPNLSNWLLVVSCHAVAEALQHSKSPRKRGSSSEGIRAACIRQL